MRGLQLIEVEGLEEKKGRQMPNPRLVTRSASVLDRNILLKYSQYFLHCMITSNSSQLFSIFLLAFLSSLHLFESVLKMKLFPGGFLVCFSPSSSSFLSAVLSGGSFFFIVDLFCFSFFSAGFIN